MVLVNPSTARYLTAQARVRPACAPASAVVASARLPLFSAPFLRGEIFSARSGSSVVADENVYPPPMANQHLRRRDILTLAGLASLAPVSVLGSQVVDPQREKRMERRPMAGTPQAPEARRRELYSLLGDLPDRKRPIGGKKRAEEERDGYVLETWDLDLNGIENVPAYLARPRGLAGRAPAVLFDHSHGGGYTIGKKEFIEGRSVPPAGSVREGPDRSWLCRTRDRSLGVRRAQPYDRARHVQRACCGRGRSCGA